jgi:hypothetical protein
MFCATPQADLAPLNAAAATLANTTANGQSLRQHDHCSFRNHFNFRNHRKRLLTATSASLKSPQTPPHRNFCLTEITAITATTVVNATTATTAINTSPSTTA